MARVCTSAGKPCSSEDELPGVLEQQRDSDRGDEDREPGPIAQRFVRKLLDHDPERGAGDHGAGQNEDGPDPIGQLRDERMQPAVEIEPGEGADHKNVAVSEINEAENAIDHGISERDQRVDRSERESVDDLLNKIVKIGHARPVV
jgi:hypothetical protein